MNVKLTKEAATDKEDLSEKEWKEIKSKINEITNKLSHKDLKLISNPLLEHSIWQLTINEEETDHRVYLDVKNGKTIILAIWNFKFTHSGDNHWKELEDRF